GSDHRTDPPSVRPLIRSDRIWEGHQLLVRARTQHPSRVLTLEVCVLPHNGGLPELPLRVLATALRCHEFLLSDGVAQPLPVPHDLLRSGIREYLTRVTPHNLSARQCI